MSRLHRPKAGFWIRLSVAIIYPMDGVLFRVRFHRLDRMVPPERGGVIIAVNHLSPIDTMLIARLVWQSGRIPRFMIKSSLFRLRGVGTVLRGTKQIPVHRGTTDAASSLRDAAAALERGEAVVIYPEGTTTKDPAGWPMQGKTGVGRLVLLSPSTPVVPLGQWGANRRRPGEKRRRRTAEALMGEPLDFSRFRDREPTPELQREITDVVMTAIREQVAQLRDETPPTAFFVPPSRGNSVEISPEGA